nr:hypothetical protein [Tanacetum cinerariifolium]
DIVAEFYGPSRLLGLKDFLVLLKSLLLVMVFTAEASKLQPHDFLLRKHRGSSPVVKHMVTLKDLDVQILCDFLDLPSEEDRLKLKELIKLIIKLSDRVLDLEKIKTAQAKEIDDLKKRVKKLERKRRSKTPRMNLFKIGTSRRRNLGEEDASKQGRNLKHRSVFEESDFDVQAMMDAEYELVARLRAEEQRRKPLTKAQKRKQI